MADPAVLSFDVLMARDEPLQRCRDMEDAIKAEWLRRMCVFSDPAEFARQVLIDFAKIETAVRQEMLAGDLQPSSQPRPSSAGCPCTAPAPASRSRKQPQRRKP